MRFFLADRRIHTPTPKSATSSGSPAMMKDLMNVRSPALVSLSGLKVCSLARMTATSPRWLR